MIPEESSGIKLKLPGETLEVNTYAPSGVYVQAGLGESKVEGLLAYGTWAVTAP